MLADFHIPRRTNDMKIAVQKNHLVGQIFYRNLVPSKKTASMLISGKSGSKRSISWTGIKCRRSITRLNTAGRKRRAF